MLGQTKNALLQKTENQIEMRVKPMYRPALKQIVKLGLNAMHAPAMQDTLHKILASGGDPADKAGESVAKLIGLLIQKSKNTLLNKMAFPATGPAGQILLCEALDFMEQAGAIKVTNETLAAATQAFGSYFLQILGVTPDKMQGMLQKAGGQGAQAALGATPAAPQAQASTQPRGIISAAQGAA